MNMHHDIQFDCDEDIIDATVDLEISNIKPSDTVCLPPEIIARYSTGFSRMMAQCEATDENLRQIYQHIADWLPPETGQPL